MKRILVCGGAGFVGSHLTRRLLNTPGVESVVVFDNLSSGLLKNIPIGDPRVLFVNANARDRDRLRKEMEGCDTIFHLAANPDISKAVSEPSIDFEQGTVLTNNVLEAARVNGVKRIIYFSGSGVYGDRDDMIFEDSGDMHPVSPYGASKLASEALISAYCHMFGIIARVFRFANIVGARQTHGVGRDFLRKLNADGSRLEILGDGKQSKSYIHIDDVLNAVFLVNDRCISDGVENPTSFVVYNVATMNYLTVDEIAKMAMVVTGRETARIEYTGGDRGWKGDVPRVRLNCAKIHSIGWRCGYTSHEAMELALTALNAELS